MTNSWRIIISLLFFCLISEVKSAKILVVSLPHYSVVAESNAIAVELVKRGHSVTFYLPSDFDNTKAVPDLPIIRYGTNMTAMFLSMAKKINDDVYADGANVYFTMRNMRIDFCNQINDVKALKKLKDEKFDYAIVNLLFFMKCIYLIPHNLNIPYASVSTAITELEIGHPAAPSFIPFILSHYGTEMSFFERVVNLFYHLGPTIMLHYLFPSYDVSKTVPKISYNEAEDLPKKSEIFLENSDFVLNFPKPTMPNFIQVGGLTTKAPKPLPTEIKKFFDDAPDGVIVMSFGSIFKPNKRTKELFISVFSKLKQRVFWKNDDAKIVNNIWMQPWLPQNDALAHPNTKLVIYHCGNNGMFESLYNAVPLLCLPHTADQLSNAKKLDHFHIGRSLSVALLTEEMILEAIQDLLTDSTYAGNITHLSRIFHSRPETPAERAASWLEYVFKFGGGHLRSNQNKLSPFQLLMGDVWCFIFTVIVLGIYVAIYSIRKCLGFICKKKNKEKMN